MTSSASPTISVIIPTLGRPTLSAAVKSALSQSELPMEIIIGADTTDPLRIPDDVRVRVVRCGPRGGGNTARMAAISEASGDLIALLDDDDEWERDKLCKQLTLMRDSDFSIGQAWVLSSQITDTDGVVRPKNLITPADNPLEYLFRKTSVRGGVGKIHTSTLLFPRWLVEDLHFDPATKYYQDPTWYIQLLAKHPQTQFAQVADALVRCQKTTGSVFNSVDWHQSANWISTTMDHLPARWRGDFALTNMLQRALTSPNSWDHVRAFIAAFRLGRPGLPAVIYGIAKLILQIGRLTSKGRKNHAR